MCACVCCTIERVPSSPSAVIRESNTIRTSPSNERVFSKDGSGSPRSPSARNDSKSSARSASLTKKPTTNIGIGLGQRMVPFDGEIAEKLAEQQAGGGGAAASDAKAATAAPAVEDTSNCSDREQDKPSGMATAPRRSSVYRLRESLSMDSSVNESDQEVETAVRKSLEGDSNDKRRQSRESTARRQSVAVMEEHVGVAFNNQGMLKRSNAIVESLKSLGSRISVMSRSGPSTANEKNMRSGRRNSQATYSQVNQTIIIFDWDDTLFPTSYLLDDLRLHHKKTLKEQKLSKDLMKRLSNGLSSLFNNVQKLLRTATLHGKVVLVTLAMRPWVMDSCSRFAPEVGKLISELGLQIIYAQEVEEGMPQVQYDKRAMSDGEMEAFYANMKGEAISRQVNAFYSQYEGQSWKNIISVGDSDFERLGTMGATEKYMKNMGMIPMDSNGATKKALTVDVNGHLLKVRTKTLKMIDQPTINELTVEVGLIHKWLPKLVSLDDRFDEDLGDLTAKVITDIQAKFDKAGC
mmetsp:Transcript_50569/g.110377  ORF Transcript_50569/g.110377 Transcript_50569/m.110377 type:complete len:521 (-) Transcript_50569:154-1716(-)